MAEICYVCSENVEPEQGMGMLPTQGDLLQLRGVWISLQDQSMFWIEGTVLV